MVSGDRVGDGVASPPPRPPRPGRGWQEGRVVRGLVDPRGGVLEGMVRLVKRLLAEDVHQRPTAQDALKDPVFSLGM